MLPLILFFYGLSFFSLGMVIFSSNTKESNFFFANKIWLLGVFGFTHAFVEWISLYGIFYPDFKEILLPFEVFFVVISFIFLFEFSRFILRYVFESQKKFHLLYICFAPFVIYPFIILFLLSMIIHDPQLVDSIVAVRYTFGFWGSTLLGIGLYMYGKTLKKLNHAKDLEYYFKILGIVFLFYAFFSGIIVDPVPHFPSSLINTENFAQYVGISHYFFRGLCAFLIAILSIKALKIFEYETQEQLAQSSSQIQEFSANASHQLKTPLASMQLQIDVTLKKDREVADYKRVLHTFGKETQTLQKLVTTFLMFAKVRHLDTKSNLERVEVDSLALDVFAEFMPIAKAKGVFLEIGELETIVIKGNRELMRVLISNLIDNAIKYTPSGKTVTLELRGLRLSVQDAGEQIPKEKHTLIFDKFYQLKSKEMEGTNSFGLGLALAKKIADMHKIALSVENNEKTGNTFSLQF